MKKKTIVCAALCCIAGVFISCQNLASVVQKPELSINSVEIAGLDFTGADLICHVNVENPNAFSIPFPNIDWQLFINTASFLQGNVNPGGTLKARETTVVDVSLHLTWEGLYTTFSSLLQAKEAAYNIALGIRFPLPLLENMTFNLEHSGVIPLPQMPKLSLGSFKITGLDFSGVELVWNINVENPNNFRIPLPDISYDFAVNGIPLVSTALEDKAEIAAAGVSAVQILLKLNYTDLIKTVASLANSGEADSALKVTSSLNMPGAGLVKSLLDIPEKFPVLQRPSISFKGIQVKELDLLKMKVDFIVSWEVENKNSFAMSIGKFDYNLTVNKNIWAVSSLANPPRLPPGVKTEIPLTISLNGISLVSDLIGIINKGTSVDFSCLGGMSLAGSLPGMDAPLSLNLPFNFSGSTTLLKH